MKKGFKKLLALVLALSMVNIVPPAVEVKAWEADQNTVIDVTDYGADPSGKHDSTQAVMDALEAAKQMEGEKTLNFPYGEYRFDKDHATTRVYHTSNTSSRSYPEKKISILLEEIDNLTLQGNGSTLLVYGDIMALAVVESSDIKMQNFVLDYKDADTVDISIVKTEEDENGNPYADIYIPEAYNYKISDDGKHIQWQGDISATTGKPYWTWEDANFCAYLVVYKGYDRTVIRANNKEASNPFTGVKSIEKTGESTVRFTYESQLPTDIVEGNIYQLSNSAWRQTAGAFFWESDRLTVENIDVHYLSGFGWLTQMCTDVEFKSVDFLPRDGSGKYTTSNADQLHVAGCGGYFKVTDCNFSMAHDDPINVHGTYMRVEEVIDAKTVRMQYIHGQQGGFRQFHPGDEVLFYSRTYLEEPDGQTEDRPFVVASSVGPGEFYTGPAENYNNTTLNLVTEIVTFTEDLPEETIADLRKTIDKNVNNQPQTQPLYVAENVTYTPAVTIKSNRMKSIPTRGILCTTRKEVIIEDNIFDNMAMSSIYLSNDADDWYESGPIRNLTIKNNTFYIRPTGQNVVWVSAIFIEPVTIRTWQMTGGGETQPKDPESLVHENITIEGNTFHMASDNVVTAYRVDGLTIRNNTIIHEDPSLAITLNTPSTLGMGESCQLDVQVTETPLTKDIFQLYDCKKVTIEGNTFDDGMNLNIQLDAAMDRSDLTLGAKEEALLTVAGDNHVRSAHKVKLISTNPDVAYIEKGKLIGVTPGKTTVYAYIEKNNTIIRSREVEVTVDNSPADVITLGASRYDFSEKDESAVLILSVNDVPVADAVFEVLDPITEKPTDKAVVEEGIYLAKKDGAVLLRASAGDSMARILMVNSFDTSYGPQGGMAEGVSIDHATQGGTSSTDEHSVQIVPQNNGNGIWTSSAMVNNIVNLPIPAELRTDLRLQVTAEGLVAKGGGWNSSGIMLYTDLDNYMFVGKRNHMDGVSTMYEQNANAQEFAGNSSANALTDMTFEIVVEGTTARIRYLDAAGVWHDVKSFDISHLQNENMKLGLAAWLNGGEAYQPTFKNIRMAKASETTQDMGDIEPKALYKSFTNKRPVIENVTLTGDKAGETVRATVDARDEDGNVASALYTWIFYTEDGATATFTSEPEYIPSRAGRLYMDVVVFDNHGKPSNIFLSDEYQIGTRFNESDKLQNLYVNGYPVEGFDPDIYNYEIAVPAGVGKIRLSYDSSDAGRTTVITGSTATTIPVNKYGANVPLHDTYVITRGTVTYNIKVNVIESSDNEPVEIMVGEESIDLKDEIRSGTDSYFVHVQQDTFPLRIKAQEGVSEIKVTRSYYEEEMEDSNQDGNIFEATVNMKAGINAYYIYITAADGISVREVKLYFFRDSYTDADLESISLNGKEIEGFRSDREDYLIHVSEEEARDFYIEAVNKEGQQTSITIKNHRLEGTSDIADLEPGLNEIIITNVAKNIWSRRFYTLNVVVVSDDNADLLTLETDHLMNPAFDIDTASYKIKNHTGKIRVSAQAQVAEAKIRMYLKGSEQEVLEKGQASHEFTLFEGLNKIYVEVTATDHSTMKVYELLVSAKGLVYASDVVAAGHLEGITNTKKDVGYGNITLDTNVDGNAKISLADEAGNKVEFDKGLGTHASSEVVFTLEEGHEFTSFEAYTGVDFAKYSIDGSTVSFEVWVDGVKKYDSFESQGGATRVTTPMQFVQVNMEGASEIKLITKALDGNAYDHSEWADACFIRSLERNPNPDDGNIDDSGSDNDGPGSGDDSGSDNDGPGSGDDSGSDNDGPGNGDDSGSDNNGPGSGDDSGSDNDGPGTMVYEGLWVTGIEEEYAYTGSPIKPDIKVFDGSRQLIEKKEYTVVHKNNKNAYEADDKGKKAPYVEIRMKGNNTGKTRIYYKIMKTDLSDIMLETDKLTAVVKPGKTANVTPVLYSNGKKLKVNKDYEIVGNIKKLPVGSHAITIKGNNNYEGEIRDIPVLINDGTVSGNTAIPMNKLKIQVSEKKLDWKEEGAVFEKIDFTGKPAIPTEGEYEYEYFFNKAAGTGYLVIKGTGIDVNKDKNVFIGTKTLPFKIEGINMNTKNITFSGFDSFKYNHGTAIYPTKAQKEDGTVAGSLRSSRGEMTEGEDYTAVYSKNIEKGMATVTLIGKPEKGYTGMVKKTFKIEPVSINTSDYEVQVSGNDIYEKNGVYYLSFTKGGTTPEVTIYAPNGKKLVSGRDYTVKYNSNKKIGETATAIVKGKGNYGGQFEIRFVPEKKDFTNENGIRVAAKDKIDNGKPNNWKTSIKVIDSNGKALSKKEYEIVSYEITDAKDPSRVGTILQDKAQVQIGDEITVTVKGTGDYAGAAEATATGTYRILEKGYDISKASFKIKMKYYNGHTIEIAEKEDFEKAIINPGKRNMILGTDFEVVEGSYIKNVEKGTAKVTLRGVGDFGGTKTVTFKIGPRDTTDHIIIDWN